MPERNYWTRLRLGRRDMLRASGIGALGFGGAALIGYGDSDEAIAPTDTEARATGTTASTNGSGGDPTGTGWYEGERSPGFDPALGMNPVNEKEHVPSGTYTRAYRDTTRQQDVDLSAAGADIEYIGDRLTRANGRTQEIIPDLLESWEIADDGLTIVRHAHAPRYRDPRPRAHQRSRVHRGGCRIQPRAEGRTHRPGRGTEVPPCGSVCRRRARRGRGRRDGPSRSQPAQQRDHVGPRGPACTGVPA